MRITSVQNPLIKDLVKLKEKKNRDLSDVILVEGDHLIEEAQKAGLIIKTIGLENMDVLISENVAKKLSQTKSGSLNFALVKKQKQSLQFAKRILVLDRVQDPGNVGTCIRSAYSFGYDAIVLSYDSADEYNDKCVRASQGALFHIPCIRMDLEKAYAFFKKNKIQIYATHVDDKSLTLSNLNQDEAMAIVMGSEGKGVSETTLAYKDATLHIETSHFESLNVAVASGIICYMTKQ